MKSLFEEMEVCNERMEIIVSAMSEQEGVTEALKAAFFHCYGYA